MLVLKGFIYLSSFLDQEEQNHLLRQVESFTYVHDRFRGRTLKRAYAQFGFTYVPGRRQPLLAQPLPDILCAAMAKGLPHCSPETQFNQCIVTRYPADAGIGWHIDAPYFGDCIMAVSLAGAAALQMKHCHARQLVCEVQVEPGSLYILSGPARRDWQHRIVPVSAERYSLTFRLVSNEPGFPFFRSSDRVQGVQYDASFQTLQFSFQTAP